MFEVAHDSITLILLKVLDSVFRIPGFSAGTDFIKNFRLRIKIVPGKLILFIPVWWFENKMNFRINTMCILDNKIFSYFLHNFQSILFPGKVPFSFLAQFALAVENPKVVKNDLVKKGSRVGHYFLELFPISRVRVAEPSETVTGRTNDRRHNTA